MVIIVVFLQYSIHKYYDSIIWTGILAQFDLI